MQNNGLQIHWQIREVPLQPKAVVARGTIAVELAQKLLQQVDLDLASFQGVAGKEMLFLFADSKKLPWVDGVIYLGKEEMLSQIYMPTYLQPHIPNSLLEQILIQSQKSISFSQIEPPFAILPHPPCIFSVKPALPISRKRLLAWLATNESLIKMKKAKEGPS